MTLPFPFAVIDFEASSLSDERSYPIGVGVAVALAANEPIHIWSSLIVPASEWIASGTWSARCAAMHGISQAGLAEGATPGEVARTLNTIAATVPRWFCDGGEYDAHWLRRLFDADRIRPSFALEDVTVPTTSEVERASFAEALAAIHAPHRAGADAERLCAALLIAYGFELREPQPLPVAQPFGSATILR